MADHATLDPTLEGAHAGVRRPRPWDINGQLKVQVNGITAPLIPAADFDGILIDVGGGKDFVSGTYINTFAATVLGGTGNDILSGSNGDDILVGGAGHDFISGDGGADSLYGTRGDDTLYGGDAADHLMGGTGSDTARSESNADTIDCETITPVDAWVPLETWDAAMDLRVKRVDGRGQVAVLDFLWGSTGFREDVRSVVREGKTFRITVGVDKWSGGSAAVMTRHLKTVTLGDLNAGTYSVVVHRTDGTAIERQRFTAT